MLHNELRGHGHGTFFRSIGAVLEYRPPASSLTNKVNKHKYGFIKSARTAIVDWVDVNLEVSCIELPL
jgi:hypothetical protein